MSDRSLREAHLAWVRSPGEDEYARFVGERERTGLMGTPTQDLGGAKALLAAWPRFRGGKRKGQLHPLIKTYKQADNLIKTYYTGAGWRAKLSVLTGKTRWEATPPEGYYFSHFIGDEPSTALPLGFPPERDPGWAPIQYGALISPDFSALLMSYGKRSAMFKHWAPEYYREPRPDMPPSGHWLSPGPQDRWELDPDDWHAQVDKKVLVQRLFDASLRTVDPFRPNPHLGEGLFGLPPGEDPFAHRGSTPPQAGLFKVGDVTWWRDSGKRAGRIFKLLPYGHPRAIGPKGVRAAYVEDRDGRMTPIALMLLQPHGGPGLHHTYPRRNPVGDARLRELERQALSGHPEAVARLHVEQVRRGLRHPLLTLYEEMGACLGRLWLEAEDCMDLADSDDDEEIDACHEVESRLRLAEKSAREDIERLREGPGTAPLRRVALRRVAHVLDTLEEHDPWWRQDDPRVKAAEDCLRERLDMIRGLTGQRRLAPRKKTVGWQKKLQHSRWRKRRRQL